MNLGLDLITRHWLLKLTALGLAILLWSLTKAETPTRVVVREVPVQVALRDPGWTLAEPPAPQRVTVTFTGTRGELLGLVGEQPRIIVPVDQVTDSAELRQLQAGWVRTEGAGAGVQVEDIRPGTVRLLFERLETRLVPVAVPTRGDLPAGLRVSGPIEVDPPAFRVSGPRSLLERLDSIPVGPVDLDPLRDTVTLRVAADTTGLGELIISPLEVSIRVPVAPVEPPTPDTVAPTDTLDVVGRVRTGRGGERGGE